MTGLEGYCCRYYTGVISRRAIPVPLALLVAVLAASGLAAPGPATTGTGVVSSIAVPAARAGSPLFPLEPAWTVTLEAPPASAAAFDGSNAYVPLRNGKLVALSLETGGVVWERRLPVESAPASAGGRIFVSNGENVLLALNATDGTTAWEQPLGTPLSAPLYVGTAGLFAGTEAGDISLFDPSGGRLLWQVEPGATLTARPALDEAKAYLPLGDNRIVALAIATGELLWEQYLEGRPAGAAVHGDRVYAGADDNALWCLDVESGRVEWRMASGGDIVGAPLVHGDSVYFVSMDHLLRALDRRSGVQRWRVPLSIRPGTGPVLVGRLLLLSGVAPEIHAFSRENGRSMGTGTTAGDLAGPPHVTTGLIEADLTIYALTGAGQFQALRAGVTMPPRYED